MTFYERAITLCLAVIIVLQWLVVGNITRTGEFVELGDDGRCYVYLQYNNGHVLQDRENGNLRVVYIRPIIKTIDCGKM